MTSAYTIQGVPEKLDTTITLPSSKSLSNRALILQALSRHSFAIHNLSAANDTVLLHSILEEDPAIWDCGNAGTAFRFLTAYAAMKAGKRELTGNNRMHERPIGPLVNALRQLGAQISYTREDGYPPLMIQGQSLKGGKVELDAGTSSQFVTALLLIAPFTEKGLQLTFTGIPVSRPYFAMTIKMLQYFNVKVQQKSNEVAVSPKTQWPNKHLTIEPDWTSASYWIGLAGLLPGSQVRFQGLTKRSWQGDEAILDLTHGFGIQSKRTDEGLLVNSKEGRPTFFEGLLTDHPDLVPTLVALCTAAKVPFTMQGVAHLRDKETDRLAALRDEMVKVGAAIQSSNEGLNAEKFDELVSDPLLIQTYDDHRLAMSSVILATSHIPLSIADPEVVDKSYPGFWEQLLSAGFLFSSS